MKKDKFITIILTIFFICLLGCDNSNPTGINSFINPNGSWSGKTSQNEDVSFTVDSNIVTFYQTKVVTPYFTQENKMSGHVSNIVDNIFSFSFPGSSPKLYITGVFTSSSSAEGTFELSSTNGTWTANKQN